jgi:tRNA_anti-like
MSLFRKSNRATPTREEIMTHLNVLARFLCVLTVGLFLNFALVGCSTSSSSPDTHSATTSPSATNAKSTERGSTLGGVIKPMESKKEPPVVVKPGDFALSAMELQAEFTTDKAAALAKYQGKTIDLSGVVKSVGDDGTDQNGLVEIVTGSGSLGLPCYTVDREPFARLAPGQTVKLQGVWPKTASEPRLRDCVIVETGPSPAIALTALQLATEYAADPEAVKTKYDGKSLILGGDVQGKITRETGNCTLFLKGIEKKSHVELWFDAIHAGKAAKINDGQPIKLFARFDKSGCLADTITFSNPGIITK